MTGIALGVGALKRRWWIVVLVLATSVAIAAVLTARQQPLFKATTSLVVAPDSKLQGAQELLRSLEVLERRTVVATFAKIPMSQGTRHSTAQALGGWQKTQGYVIRASAQPFTNIIRIEVTGPDSQQASLIANTVAKVTAQTARSMYRLYSLRALGRAMTSGVPFYPNPRRNYAVAAAIGLALGFFVALLPDARRLPIRNLKPVDA